MNELSNVLLKTVFDELSDRLHDAGTKQSALADKMMNSARRGHLLLVHFFFFHCSQQLASLGLERGIGGGEGRWLTSFSLDGSIRSWLFKPACLEKEQTWGKRGVLCSREVAAVVVVVMHFGCHRHRVWCARRERERGRESEKEKQTEGE